MDYISRYYKNKAEMLSEYVKSLEILLEIAETEKKEPTFKERIALRVDAAPVEKKADAAATEFFGSVEKMANLIKSQGVKPELESMADEVQKKSQNLKTGNPFADMVVGGVASFAGEKISDALKSDTAANIVTRLAMKQRHEKKYKEIDAERKKLLDAGKTPAQAEADLKSRYRDYYYKLNP